MTTSDESITPHQAPDSASARTFPLWPWWLAALLAAIIPACYWGTQHSSRSIPLVEVAGEHRSSLASALKHARDLVVQRPRSGTAWGRYGMLLRAHDIETAANECFEEAGRLEPTNVRWPYFLGVSTALADPERSLVSLKRASEIVVEDPLPRLRLVELLMDFHRLSEAEQILQKMPATTEPQRLLFDRLRWALLANDQTLLKSLVSGENAATTLQTFQAGSNRRQCLELLAQIHQSLGNRMEAGKISTMAKTMESPNEGWDDPYVREIFEMRRDPAWQGAAAQTELQQGQIAAGLHRLEGLILDDPRQPQWPILLSRQLIRLRQYPQADQVLRPALKAHPLSAELHCEMANLRFYQKEWESAIQFYATAIRLKPDYALAYFNLGQSELRCGQRDLALANFRNALRCQPNLVAAHLSLVELLIQRHHPDDFAEIEEHLALATKLDPQNRRLDELLTTFAAWRN